MKKIAIIGSTGSVGRQALDVIRLNRELFDVVLLSANSNRELLEEQCAEFGTKKSCLTHGSSECLISLLDETEADLVLIAAVGAAGILPAYETVKKGTDIALANKESIVAAGRLILDAAKKSGARVIPVDSEHSAVYQCLMGHKKEHVAKIILTASGGAFRKTPNDALEFMGVKEALKHPNWNMGSKITVDSATMMNKGLELIEARYLFDIEPDRLDVVIHPQSIVHSAVSYTDGSMLAQMGYPDMRVPISFALGLPERIESGVRQLDLCEISRLDFFKPDLNKYGCLRIAFQVLKKDMNGPMIIMNAANEIAVEHFMRKSISFIDIAPVIENVLDAFGDCTAEGIDEILELDGAARRWCSDLIQARR
ncbi:1-deoxy-D-xylulose-5-phosphate reductoisomerase [Geovibrio thiophilus]|uniref:1-deoxy-D-xylulose 5-phosphate reductoisomerase n=1 Tax=Geovibrio thiophilus TaxID=139438 RepID=A0A3R5Z0U9_9BACT|nr:1-deoxy-D-xylulose-5-phosphate reductoisomerase [Geovibrio thiophilus]QAR34233.1 1-deoxy-D-xylulose-5-phosphate reductoisomerase [Geovibrio thiophilus]